MKKIVVTVIAASMVIMGSAQAFAMEENTTRNSNAYGTFNFGQKLLQHENMTVQDVKYMYADHHGIVGAMPSNKFEKHDECMAE
ncbi:hypothetical protein ACJ2A9_01080 [Anaerobacillus sp. MEB173]|uniref:hypothetical protein n=1 Tax=Anaerobacillus sp. MEB173 TaxID=3383345 RepID=UPI003F91B392